MIGYIFFAFWRFLEIVTLIPTLGMLSYFVSLNDKANILTPASILVLFIVSVLGCVWAILTLLRHKSTRASAHFVSFIDLCFVGAFIAGVYELRFIAKQNCSSISTNSNFYISIGANGVSGNNPFTGTLNKDCAMLKASFAFGIMNCIFFFISSAILLMMHRSREEVVVRKETVVRRRSHDSRRGHSRSGSSHHRRSHDSRRYDRPYV